MQRKVAFILAIVWGVILLLFAGYAWLANNQNMPQQGDLQRDVEQLVFFGGGQTAVTITHAAQPNLVCPPQRRTANIVLLIDKSGSMVENGVDGFSEALSAAEAFVNVVDLDKAQVAIAFFDDQVYWANEFSQDKTAILQNLAAYTAEGPTNIANALNEAGQRALTASQDANALPVIVLLSDGADDPANARIVARQLHDNDVRVVTIALGLTGQEQLDFLEGIATSPADAYETLPAELQQLYSSIAESFNNAVALDVTYSETVNPELTIVPGSQQPDGRQVDNQLQWQLSSMTNEGVSFSYAAAVNGLGRYPLNSEEGFMSYIGCVSGPVILPLAAGPDLLVLPAPFPLVLLALLPFLLPIILMFWRKKPKQGPLPPRPQKKEPAPKPIKDTTPAWLKALTNTAVLAEDTASFNPANADMSPTVIIGLGVTGRAVLNQIGRTLRSRYGGQIPLQVRLLQIDIQPEHAAHLEWKKPRHLADDEWTLLTPDLKEMQRFLQKDVERNKALNQYLNWYDPYAPSGRMQGRMSVFYDLRRGSSGSVLWNSLHKTVHQLDNPKIKIVGATFDDGSSGLLVDIARLTQIVVAGSGAEHSNVDVEMWLTTPVGKDWSPEITNGRRVIRRNEQQPRTMATLREMERFQRNARQPFEYVPRSNLQDQLRSVTHSAVVQTVFLFEPRPDVDDVTDHLNVMVDGLLAVLHTPTQQALTQHLTASQLQAGALANQRSMGTACSLGAYAVRFPLGVLEEAVAWRAVYDLLFEELLGVQPCRQQQPNGLYSEIAPERAVPDNGRIRRETAETLVDAFISNLDSRGFMQAVAHQADKLLNGEDGDMDKQPLNRRGGLLQAQRWLESVRALVRREGEPDVVRQLTALIQLLEKRQKFMTDEVEPIVAQHWRDRRAELEALVEQKGRQWVLDEDLEWKLYQQRIRSTPRDYQTLARAAKRFGWQLQYKEKTREWQLDFLVPPVNFVWNDEAYLPDYVVEQKPEDIAEAVYHTAVTLARRNLQNETVLDATLNPREWYELAEPGFTQTYTGAQDLSSQEAVLLVAPEARQTGTLRAKLESGANNIAVQLCATADSTAMTVLRVQGHMPLNTYSGYSDETWETSYVDPNLYVWRGEQIASQIEGESEINGRLDAKFVGWLQLDRRLLNLFCEGYVYGLWDRQNNKWYLPGLESWPGDTLGDALENLFGNDSRQWPAPMRNPNPNQAKEAIAALESAIQERKAEIADNEEIGGLRGYLRQARKEMLPPLTQSPDAREQNFALYLSGFLKNQ